MKLSYVIVLFVPAGVFAGISAEWLSLGEANLCPTEWVL